MYRTLREWKGDQLEKEAAQGNRLTPWLMEPGGSMLHSQGLSDNPYPDSNQPNYPHWYLPISSRSILIVSSHLHLGLPIGVFLAGLPVKFPHSGRLIHLNLLDLITLTISDERYKLWNFSLWSLLHSPFSSLLVPNIRLKILFSNTIGLHSSLNVRDQENRSSKWSTSWVQ